MRLKHSSRRLAFTLIELLVVIAIIAIVIRSFLAEDAKTAFLTCFWTKTPF